MNCWQPRMATSQLFPFLSCINIPFPFFKKIRRYQVLVNITLKVKISLAGHISFLYAILVSLSKKDSNYTIQHEKIAWKFEMVSEEFWCAEHKTGSQNTSICFSVQCSLNVQKVIILQRGYG